MGVPTPAQVTPEQKAWLGGLLDRTLGARKRTGVRGLSAVAPLVLAFAASHPTALWVGVGVGWFNFALSLLTDSSIGDATPVYVPSHAADPSTGG